MLIISNCTNELDIETMRNKKKGIQFLVGLIECDREWNNENGLVFNEQRIAQWYMVWCVRLSGHIQYQ